MCVRLCGVGLDGFICLYLSPTRENGTRSTSTHPVGELLGTVSLAPSRACVRALVRYRLPSPHSFVFCVPLPFPLSSKDLTGGGVPTCVLSEKNNHMKRICHLTCPSGSTVTFRDRQTRDFFNVSLLPPLLRILSTSRSLDGIVLRTHALFRPTTPTTTSTTTTTTHCTGGTVFRLQTLLLLSSTLNHSTRQKLHLSGLKRTWFGR